VRADPTAPWLRDDRFTASLSTAEPEWRADQPVPEMLDERHRILWEVWGEVGMTWFELPRPAGTVTT
jgi:hypothetical protein